MSHRIAVKLDAALVDAAGQVVGHDAGATLVRRLLRIFPDAILIGPGPRRAAGFDVMPLEFIDGTTTVVINMDVIDSPEIHRTLAVGADEPKVMNFLWWRTSDFKDPVDQASLALSMALFPTFANSERTAREARELVGALTVTPLAEKSRFSWVNLGIRLEHIQPRHEPTVPTILYPAIYLSERKRPELFLEIVDKVHRRSPIKVEVRLHESHLVSELAMAFSRRPWIWVGPLTPTRESYWDALSHTTAFLATASEESYGLQYVEALAAGAIGVLPDLPWAHALVPEGYPYLYRSPHEAEDLLLRVIADPGAARAALDAIAGGSFRSWLRERHNDDTFDHAVVNQLQLWFG